MKHCLKKVLVEHHLSRKNNATKTVPPMIRMDMDSEEQEMSMKEEDLLKDVADDQIGMKEEAKTTGWKVFSGKATSIIEGIEERATFTLDHLPLANPVAKDPQNHEQHNTTVKGILKE